MHPQIYMSYQYHAISEGKIRHLGPENKIGIFFGTISGLWSQLGPSPKFGTLFEALTNKLLQAWGILIFSVCDTENP